MLGTRSFAKRISPSNGRHPQHHLRTRLVRWLGLAFGRISPRRRVVVHCLSATNWLSVHGSCCRVSFCHGPPVHSRPNASSCCPLLGPPFLTCCPSNQLMHTQVANSYSRGCVKRPEHSNLQRNSGPPLESFSALKCGPAPEMLGLRQEGVAGGASGEQAPDV